MLINEAIKQDLIAQSIDLHCHGIGPFDFTEITPTDLKEIEAILAKRNHHIILTLYLPKQNFRNFLDLLDYFHKEQQQDVFSHIMGFGLEGPLLASHGGTPEVGVWFPTQSEWQELAACGKKGLIYSVLSPDIQLLPHYIGPAVTWIAETLLANGVLPAPGHFLKSDPKASAQALQSVFDVVKAWGKGPIITDHLYNDMPHNFKHAWRTAAEKEKRSQELAALHLDSWSLESLDDNLGAVPAVIIKNALAGLVKACINFDGEHVDLAILRKTIDLVGAENILLMTDSTESHHLGGTKLSPRKDSSLLYQEEGIVAVGTQGIEKQVDNLLTLGLSLEQITGITSTNARKVFEQQQRYLKENKHESVDSI